MSCGCGGPGGHLSSCVQRKSPPHLGEEVDAVGDRVHGDRVSSDEEASKVNSGQVVELCIQTGQLPDVVADHME